MSVNIEKQTRILELIAKGQQRQAIDYMYDEFTSKELLAFGQIGNRIMAMTETVQTKKGRESEARRRSIGGRSGAGEEFIKVR
jgi:hypothetical protein